MTSDRWVETPKFILRRDCLSYVTRRWQPGRFLEIGAGTGRLTATFLERGFTGTCYDIGTESRKVMRRSLSRFAGRIEVIDSLDVIAPASFDYVFAFEVMEHISSDDEALRSWIRFLKPGGRILISVPAHMRKYGQEDRAVGHHRRYERQQLTRMLTEADCVNIRVLSYGFPIATLTRHGSQLVLRLRARRDQAPPPHPEELSIRSGIERSNASLRLARVLNRHTLAPFIALQRMFFETDLGDGYVAHGVRATGR